MVEFLVLTVTSVAAVIFLIMCQKWRQEMELELAIGACLENGIACELKSWQLYRRKTTEEFILLKFDHQGNAIGVSEEVFPDDEDGKSDAVKKFLRKTK